MDVPWLSEWTGWVAGVLTTVSFIPQVIKTWRSGRTRDISLAMWMVFSAGLAMWILYAILIGSLPILVANIITLSLAGTVLALKVRNLKREREEP